MRLPKSYQTIRSGRRQVGMTRKSVKSDGAVAAVDLVSISFSTALST